MKPLLHANIILTTSVLIHQVGAFLAIGTLTLALVICYVLQDKPSK